MNTSFLFAYQGTNFNFPECRVRSFPTAKVTWNRLFHPLAGGRFIADAGFLSILRVRYEDEGYYVCEAENRLGKEIKVCIEFK